MTILLYIILLANLFWMFITFRLMDKQKEIADLFAYTEKENNKMFEAIAEWIRRINAGE